MSPKKKINTDQVANEFSSESAFFQTTSTQVDKTTSTQVVKPTKPQVDKYTTHLRPASIEYIKDYAYHHKMKDYEVVQLAIDRLQESETQPTASVPAPVVEPAPVEQKTKIPTPEIPPLPDDLAALQLFADQHFVSRNEAERLTKQGHIHAVKGKWKDGKLHVLFALDAKGRREFWAQFHNAPDFRSCDDCPHMER